MTFVILPTLVLVAIVAVAAFVSVRRSSLRISEAGVEVRNAGQPPRTVPLDEVDRFEEPPKIGNLSSVRPTTAVLVLRDGSKLSVRSIVAPGAGRGVDALNARLAALRAVEE